MQAKILRGHNLRCYNYFLTGDMDHVRRGQGIFIIIIIIIIIMAATHAISVQFGRDRITLTELAATILSED